MRVGGSGADWLDLGVAQGFYVGSAGAATAMYGSVYDATPPKCLTYWV